MLRWQIGGVRWDLAGDIALKRLLTQTDDVALHIGTRSDVAIHLSLRWDILKMLE